ncbi:NAD(P)-binding protein [Calocera cornea HHB12733]|uniref:NAD(P)-binding protein n=1 Tax=Calocera cornea HHB12733 TaxID=1353952 RepID=A0A165E914_9BASI|nr:NAD(P)-binding protein [Calocera cornea HHB12733]
MSRTSEVIKAQPSSRALHRPEPTVYLVSGANKGIGLALVTALAALPSTLVFAGAGTPSTATALHALAAQYPSKVKERAGRLDVLIANAGMHTIMEKAVEVGKEAMLEHFEVNALGPLVLFQSAHPLLARSPKPKFLIVSTMLGSVTLGPGVPFPCTPYGTSKTALNWIAVKLPGLVATDMATAAAKVDPALGGFPLITPQESAAALLGILGTAERGEEPAKLMGHDGVVYAW